MRVKNFLLIASVAALAMTAGVLARTQLLKRRAEFKPYTITWQVTDYDESGAVVNQYTQTRYTARDGRWYTIRKFSNGLRQEYFCVPGEGVFARGKDRLLFLSEAPKGPPPAYTEEEVRRSPFFLRSDEVLGLKVFVAKSGPGNLNEVYHAPGLNYDWIKRVERRENGNL
ncbi:MAG TPA: hypothetical protein VE713_15205 [Pyrinomonadaceae bacterium]|jgi:hypothetical protein|nr:hypothetical protein [Pyrinomonadaceae bacterium]